MNPQILFNSTLALLTTGLILILKGIFVLGFATLIIAIGTSIVWLMSGFFDKFEYKTPETELDNEKRKRVKVYLNHFNLNFYC